MNDSDLSWLTGVFFKSKIWGKWSVIWVKILPLVILALVALVYMLSITDALCSDTLVGWWIQGRKLCEKRLLTKSVVGVSQLKRSFTTEWNNKTSQFSVTV